MNNSNNEVKEVNGGVELDDDALDGVAGGLVQLINPSSGSYQYFLDGTVCQHCGYPHGTYTKILRRIECNKCRKKMVSRRVKPAEVGHFAGSGCM